MENQSPLPGKQSTIKIITKKLIKYGLPVASALLLGYILYRERATLLGYHFAIDYLSILKGFLFYTGTLLLSVVVWQGIMGLYGKKIPYFDHFLNVSISNIAKRIPGTIWYIVWRSELYQRHTITGKETAVASALEVFFQMISGLILSLVIGRSLLIQYRTAGIILYSIIALFTLLMIIPKSSQFIRSKLNIQITKIQVSQWISWIVQYMIIWVLGGLILFSVSKMVYPELTASLSQVISIWVFVGVFSYFLFFLPTNLGLSELGISVLLSAFMPPGLAVIVSVATRVIIIIYEIIWAVISGLILYQRIRRNNP